MNVNADVLSTAIKEVLPKWRGMPGSGYYNEEVIKISDVLKTIEFLAEIKEG